MLNALSCCRMVLISLSLNDDSGVDGEGGPLSLLFSTPFWSFGLTGFGLSGILMELLVRNSASWFNHLVALSMGAGMGLLATRLMRVIGQRDADSLVRSDDLIGWRSGDLGDGCRATRFCGVVGPGTLCGDLR